MRALTILVGIVPATLLVIFAAILLFEAAASVLDPGYTLAASIVLLLGVLAVLGFVAMLHTICGSIDRNVAWGLAGGIIANLVAVVMLTPIVGVSAGSLYLLYGPMTVAAFHLARYLLTRWPISTER